MKKVYTVYRHITPDGKIYVGQTGDDPVNRWGSGTKYRANEAFTSAVNFFGWGNIRHEILYQGTSESEAKELERSYIRLWDTMNPEKGYNILPGDLSRPVLCVETGVVYGSIHQAAREIGIKRDCIRDVLSGRYITAAGFHWCLAEDAENFQIDQTRRSTAKKKVVNLDTGEVFESLAQAARKCNTTAQGIGQVCKHLPNRIRAGGYRWAYFEEVS